MKTRSQFFASMRREWLEITRNRKLFLYVMLTAGTVILNLLFQYFSPISFIFPEQGIVQTTASWYSSQSQFNQIILTVYLSVVLFLLKDNLTKEVEERKVFLPFSVGLLPKSYIGAKYIVQILVPSAIAFLGSLINGGVTVFLFENYSLFSQTAGIISISISDVFMSSVSVLFISILFLVVQFSFSTLLKRSNLAFVITIVFLLFGDPMVEMLNIGVFTPNLLFTYAISLIKTGTMSDFIFSTVITSSIIALLCVASILVFSDRFEKS